MISLYLRPDKTQVVKAKIRKDKTLNVVMATEIQSYWDVLKKGVVKDEDGYTSSLSDLFHELKTITSVSYEEVYIVLPDSLFSVDCYDYTSEQELTNLIKENLGRSLDELYSSFAVEATPGTSHKKTLFVIEHKYVDRIIEAADKENIALASIEPASLPFFRSQASWQEEHFIIEVFKNQATLVSFSPVAGIFRLNEPALSEERLLNNPEADNTVTGVFAQHDFTAEKTFSSMNVDVPFTILTENKKILQIESVKKRLAKPMAFPNFVSSDIPLDYQQDWMSVIGTLMQSYTKDDDIYSNLPPFLNVYTANVLPEQVRLDSKFRQWKHTAKKVCRFLIVFLAALTFAEISASIYFNSIHIPAHLQADYDKAQRDIKDIDAEIKIITEAKKEDEHPIQAFSLLVKDRPNDCGFNIVSIGGNGQQPADAEWVQLTAVSSNPMIFQDYMATLSHEDIFSNVSISKIDTDSSGFKIADIVLGKKGE